LISQSIAKRYAKGLFAVGEKDGRYREYLTAMESILEVFNKEKQLGRALMLPILEMKKRKELLGDIMKACDAPLPLANMFSMLLEKNRMGYINLIKDVYSELVDEKEGRIRGTLYTAYPLAENGIVLIRPASFKTGLTSFTDLKKNVIKKIAMGNPATVPAGMYAEQTLRNQKIWDSIKDKMIYCEHVRQVLDYVARGEVDAGIVFSTDTAVRAKEVTVVVMAPEGIYNKALYPIAVVRDTKNEALSKMFVDFVLSAEGKKLLEKYGLKSMK